MGTDMELDEGDVTDLLSSDGTVRYDRATGRCPGRHFAVASVLSPLHAPDLTSRPFSAPPVDSASLLARLGVRACRPGAAPALESGQGRTLRPTRRRARRGGETGGRSGPGSAWRRRRFALPPDATGIPGPPVSQPPVDAGCRDT